MRRRASGRAGSLGVGLDLRGCWIDDVSGIRVLADVPNCVVVERPVPTRHRHTLVVIGKGERESVIFEGRGYGQLHASAPHSRS